MKSPEWHLNELYSFLSNCLLRLCQVPCVRWFYVQEHKSTWRRWLHVHVVRRHNWSSWRCPLMSASLFFWFFFIFSTASVCCRCRCCGADGTSLFCVNFTTPFRFPEPHTVWHPPTRSISSLLLAAPLLTCRVQFGSHSSHFLLSVASGILQGMLLPLGFLLLLLKILTL